MKKIAVIILTFLLMILPVNNQVFAEDNIETSTDNLVTKPISDSVAVKDTELSQMEPDNEEADDDYVVDEMPTEYIPVEDIVISEFKDEMYVKDTQTLSATIFPQNATKQTVQYSSSDDSIATIDRTGKLTAISSGNCKIYANCDELTVSYNLKVKVKTEAINVVGKFLVLKPEQQENLKASVSPAEAPSELTYKSSDENIVSVDKNGNITAHKLGNASIIISNGDQTISVNIIVNTDGNSKDNTSTNDSDSDKSTDFVGELEKTIHDTTESTIVVSGVKVVSTAALKQLYGTNRTLIIEFDDYDISINGMDIVNVENELNTELSIENNDKFIQISTNSKVNLPGNIKVRLKNSSVKYKFLYIYNEYNGDYTRLKDLSNNEFMMSSIGKYYVSEHKLEAFQINVVYIAIVVVVILILCLIYIFSKKKYWFW